MSSQVSINRKNNLKKATNQIPLSNGVICGGKELTIISGPCAVEDRDQMVEVADNLAGMGINCLRGCIYKPRTSPYSFQGVQESGIDILKEVKQKFDTTIVTEVMSGEHTEAVADVSDVFQIGSRNMQNFELLKHVGKLDKPVILKRGLAATIEEFLLAAEYILSGGNKKVILCERGIRSFDPQTRNVLDLGAVAVLKQQTNLPVIVDPSHAAGKNELVADLARAAVAVGADGLIIECHPRPAESVSDARQALSFSEMNELLQSLEPIAYAIGRNMSRTSLEAPLGIEMNSPFVAKAC